MIRILIADDHAIVRAGLKRILAEHPDMKIVGEAADGDETLAALKDLGTDVLLLDVSMPGPGVLEVIGRLRARQTRPSILVLSVHAEEQYAVRTLRAGASGYLMKDRTPEELVDAIRKVHAGGRYISESLAEKLALNLVSEGDSRPHEKLSDREFEVMLGLVAGESSKEIAGRLALSPKTVSTYRARVLEKLELKTTADLVRYALENDLAPDPR